MLKTWSFCTDLFTYAQQPTFGAQDLLRTEFCRKCYSIVSGRVTESVSLGYRESSARTVEGRSRGRKHAQQNTEYRALVHRQEFRTIVRRRRFRWSIDYQNTHTHKHALDLIYLSQTHCNFYQLELSLSGWIADIRRLKTWNRQSKVLDRRLFIIAYFAINLALSDTVLLFILRHEWCKMDDNCPTSLKIYNMLVISR